MIKNLGKNKASKIFPFQDEATKEDQMKELMDQMKEDPAFQSGMVYIQGKGFLHKSKINANNGNAT